MKSTHSIEMVGNLDTPARQRAAVFALFLLMAQMIIGPHLSAQTGTLTGEGNVLRQIGYTLTLALALWSAGTWSNLERLLVLPFSMVVLLTWCALSVFWAINPDIAVRRLLLTVIIIFTIFLIVEQLKFDRTIDALRAALLLVLAANWFALIAIPEIGRHQFADLEDIDLNQNWRGVFLHKNFAGPVCCFTILLYFFDSSRQRPLLRWGVITMSFAFLYFTQSKTSLWLLPLCLLAGATYFAYSPRHFGIAAAAVTTLMLLAAIALPFYVDELLTLIPVYDPAAFTGRGTVWAALIYYIQDNFWLGAGYGSFWNIGADSPIYSYASNARWVTNITSAHNGYLDLAIQLGAPGLILAIMAFCMVPVARLLASTTIEKSRAALLVAILTFCIGHNFTESSILDRDAIVQIFFCFAIALTHVATRPSEGRLDKT